MCLDILKSLRGTFECKVLYGEPEKFVVLGQQAVEHRHLGSWACNRAGAGALLQAQLPSVHVPFVILRQHYTRNAYIMAWRAPMAILSSEFRVTNTHMTKVRHFRKKVSLTLRRNSHMSWLS